MSKRYLEPTQKLGAALFSRKIKGEVVMLNLLRFREVADYSLTPDIRTNRISKIYRSHIANP